MHPFRLRIKDKKPVQLKVNISNSGPDEKLLSYDVIVSSNLALDKSGFKTQESKRVGKMASGESTEQYFDIFPRGLARGGTYPVLIRVTEHYNNFDMVKNEVNKKLDLRVED